MWFSKLSRIRALLAEKSSDPWLRGRAAQVVGTALIADGLVGIENPLDGRKKRVGIFGAALLTGAGVLFFLLGGWLVTSTSPYRDGVSVQGTVTSVERSVTRDSSGESVTCTVTVAYEVDGQRYQVTPSMGSDSYCSLQGQQLPVSYREANPASGRVILPGAGFLKIFRFIGLFILIAGVLKFLTRLAECIVGLRLLLWGRRQVREHPATDDSALLRELKLAWSNGVGEPHEPQTPSQQPSSGPPAGWYLDPHNSSQLRWWDGAAWSDIVQPATKD